MKLEECYTAFKGDFADIMSRIPREASVIKYLRKFAETDEFEKCTKAVEAGDAEVIFATSHNLKGMAANLGIEEFRSSISEVCEATRGGAIKTDLAPLMEKATADYKMTIDAIAQLED